MDGIASGSSRPSYRAEPAESQDHLVQHEHGHEHEHEHEPEHEAATLKDELRALPSLPCNNFAFTPSQLHRLLTERTLVALGVFGGLRGLALGLRTDLSHGLSADETSLDGTVGFDEAVAAARDGREPVIQPIEPLPARSPLALKTGDGFSPNAPFVDRRRIFGANRLPRLRQKSFLRLMWIAFNDKLIILLAISAGLSLVIGIYQSVADEASSNVEWVDGLTVVVAIVVIVLASAATDWQKNHRFLKLTQRNQDRHVTVLRSGAVQQISICAVMVGDIVHVEAGEVVVADGVLVESSSLYIDESSITGESQLSHKTVPGDTSVRLGGSGDSGISGGDPFILSGTTVRRGIGRYVITSIGDNSTHGKTLMSLGEGVDITPLQQRLGRLGKQLIIFGAAAGAVYFFILFVRYLVRLPRHEHRSATQRAEAFLHIVMLAIAIVVITVPEGLALNVTIALAFATKKMLKDNNLVRLIRSCEVMGSATCICSDKTGTLTQNKMAIVAGRVGLDSGFDDGEVPVNGSGDLPSGLAGLTGLSEHKLPTSRLYMPSLSAEVKALIKDSIALNSTAFERDRSADAEFWGSSTETSLLYFGRQHLAMGSLSQERANSPVVAILPFDSSRKWMAVLVRLPDGRFRLLVKGAAEIVFEYCAYVIADPTYRLTTARLAEGDRTAFRDTIQEYAGSLLRPVAMAYRDFDESEVLESPGEDLSIVNLEWLASGLILIGFFGLRDPLRPGVVESVRQCQEAGVFVRMVTGDNFLTARAVASECGIYTPGGVAMAGATFRKLTREQREAIIPRLQVLARSSPEDKLLLVTYLREMGETVAVTGDGTNDALALKAADVGFAMGLQGTEVAKEAASIILLDDNFASIVKALGWGRTVIDAVKKFCQFQFTINITAGILATVSELVGDSIFTVVQLLWINLIMDIFASLALATDHPSAEFLKRKPEPRNSPLVSITMWKMILGQAIYQCLVVLLVHYIGWDLLSPNTMAEVDKLQSLVFNIYVWMQFFNQHNCRRVDNKIDIYYQGILTNPWFLGVQAVTVVGQFVIMFKGGEAFDTVPLSGSEWGWSMLFGVLSIPLGALIRQVPDRYVLSFFLSCKSFYLYVTRPLRRCFGTAFRRRRSGPGGPHGESMIVQSGRTILHPLDPSFGLAAHDAEVSAGKRAVASSSGETGVPELDLQRLIVMAKQGVILEDEMLEIHPRTLKNDPILVARSSTTLPPSQDPVIQRHMIRGERKRRRPEPRRSSRRANVGSSGTWTARPTQARTGQTSRGWFTWEGLLRSQRR